MTPGGEIDLGTTETTPTIGITDYSRRVTDDFGTTTVVERGFARRMTVRMALPSIEVDALQQKLAELRASAAQWVADDRFAWLSVNGFYKEFELDLAVGSLSFCRLTVEGLAETEVVADPGGDPAAPGEVSSLRLLQPLTISGAALAASNVDENDYAAWAAGTVYDKAARVIRGTNHRIYEGIAAGNVGNDPVSSLDDWIDIGPTNRWAMFDQALGTTTTAISPIVVTLAPGAIDAIALLDVLGSTVRVQGAGYDRTLPVAGGSVLFADLPADAGPVTVTIAGNVMVSVGTLLAGKIVSLGVTEASPTAGITDFSRKTTDDFGTTTVVERAWSKRMNVRAMIRTDAVDLVANRIAAVRARPSLWIGAAGSDSLTVYGFFRDFSIEVGEATSRLSLSIEGLSKAAPRSTGQSGATPDQVALIESIRDLVDGRVDFYFQTSEPSTGGAPAFSGLLLEDGSGLLLFEDGVTLLELEGGSSGADAPPADEGDIWYNPDAAEWRRLEGGVWALKAGFGALGEALIAAAGARALADGKVTTFTTFEAPTEGVSVGDLWIRLTETPRVLRTWNGMEWEVVAQFGADKTSDNAALGDGNRVRYSPIIAGQKVGYQVQGFGGGTVLQFDSFALGGRTYVQGSFEFSDIGQGASISTSQTDRILVRPGERLSVQLFVVLGTYDNSGHMVRATISWMDGAGGFIGFSPVGEPRGAGSWTEMAFVTVPPNAFSAYIEPYVSSDIGGAGRVNLAISDVCVTSAGLLQTEHPGFTPGPSNESGADVTRTVSGSGTTVTFDYLGATTELPRDLVFRLMGTVGQIFSDITWTYRITEGLVNGFGAGPTQRAMVGTGSGTLTLTALGATSKVTVTATYPGGSRDMQVELIRDQSSPPVTSGGGSGGGGSSGGTTGGATGQTLASMSGGWPSHSSSSDTVLATFNVTPGTTTVNLAASLVHSPGGGSSRSGTVEQRWQREASPGVWSDVPGGGGSEYYEVIRSLEGTPNEPSYNFEKSPASITSNVSAAVTSGTPVGFRLVARSYSVTASFNVTGSASITT